MVNVNNLMISLCNDDCETIGLFKKPIYLVNVPQRKESTSLIQFGYVIANLLNFRFLYKPYGNLLI